jgi:hypothetical protein
MISNYIITGTTEISRLLRFMTVFLISTLVFSLAKCAVNPRPIGRGYKALKNNVFY